MLEMFEAIGATGALGNLVVTLRNGDSVPLQPGMVVVLANEFENSVRRSKTPMEAGVLGVVTEKVASPNEDTRIIMAGYINTVLVVGAVPRLSYLAPSATAGFAMSINAPLPGTFAIAVEKEQNGEVAAIILPLGRQPISLVVSENEPGTTIPGMLWVQVEEGDTS